MYYNQNLKHYLLKKFIDTFDPNIFEYALYNTNFIFITKLQVSISWDFVQFKTKNMYKNTVKKVMFILYLYVHVSIMY